MSGALGLLNVLTLIALSWIGIAVSSAEAQAETRTLRMYYTHTRESITVTFKKDGKYVQSGLKKLNHFLRDFRRNEPARMDPELFDVVWEIYQASGGTKPIHVISGYRSPRTNNMLRRRGRKVAKNSQHTQGKALDFFIPGVSIDKLRALGLKAHAGGVGFYRNSFVHIDTGRVRHWPRMSRRQLSKVFPKGQTIHVPSDGRKMKRYAVAKRNLSKGLNYDGSRRLSGSSPSLLARIFKGGGGDEDEGTTRETVAEAKPTPKPEPKPAAKPERKPEANVAAKKPSGPDPFAAELKAAKRKQEEAPAVEDKPETQEANSFAIARAILPKRRPQVEIPTVAALPDQRQTAAEAATELALATPQPRLEPAAQAANAAAAPAAQIDRPSIDVATRTGNTVAQPSTGELDRLKNRIQVALARQRELSVAERATEAQASGAREQIAALKVPTPRPQKAVGKQETAMITAAVQPSATTTPSWRASAPTATTSGAKDDEAATIAVPKPGRAEKAARAVEQQKPTAAPVAVTASLPSMRGELQLGNLYGNNVKEWAIATSTRVGPIARLEAPDFVVGSRRAVPAAVYAGGFAYGRPQLATEGFSGKALARTSFAAIALN